MLRSLLGVNKQALAFSVQQNWIFIVAEQQFAVPIWTIIRHVYKTFKYKGKSAHKMNTSFVASHNYKSFITVIIHMDMSFVL